MTGQFNHGAPHYRCRYPDEYAQRKGVEHPKTVYLREDALVPKLDEWLAKVFDETNLDATAAALAAASAPDDASVARAEAARRKLADCDGRLAKYRAALEAGTEPVIVGQWIADVQAERLAAERELAASTPGAKALSKKEVRALLAAVKEATAALATADPKIKAELYAELGVEATYFPDERKVIVEAHPGLSVALNGSPKSGVPGYVSEGGVDLVAHAPVLRGELHLDAA